MKSILTIKDLALDKQLDSKSMSAVRGGSNVNMDNINAAFGGGFASPAIVVAPVTQVDARSTIDTTTLQNFGGFQFAALH